jgi:beta-glucosidase
VPRPAADAPGPDSPEVARELRAAAAAGFVLARNEGAALPLDRATLRRVALIGPNAGEARTLGGGSATVFPPYTVSPLDGLRVALGDGVTIEHSPGVRNTDRIPPARLDLLRLPDGSGPGLEVRLFGSDGGLLAREHRRGAALTWLGSFTDGRPISDVAAVEVHTVIRAPEAGTYQIGASGLGPFRLTLSDRVVVDGTIELPPDADPVEAFMRPPQRTVPVELDAGAEVTVALRHEPLSASGFGDAPLAGVMFQLNAARVVSDNEELERAAALAAAADVAIVVVGTTEEVESEGFDRSSLALPGRQDELVRRVVAANPHTVVVVNSGAPVLLPWRDEVAAVLLSWFPGQEFGNALADVLLGDVEPGGRLPTVWPETESGPVPSTRPVDGVLEYPESIHIGQRGYDRAGVRPAFPFGHGFGYTTWEYLDVAGSAGGGALRVRLRNTGARPGREVVQVYASRPESAVERPVRWLAGFAAVEAAAGAEVVADVTVATRAFQHWDAEAHAWVTEPGRFTLHVGPSAADLRLVMELEPAAA